MGIPEQTVDRDASLDQEAVRTCRICGCTDDQACPSGCWWVEDEDIFSDLCSACAPFLDALPQLLGLFRALEELAHEGTTVTGWARAWEAFDKVNRCPECNHLLLPAAARAGGHKGGYCTFCQTLCPKPIAAAVTANKPTPSIDGAAS